MLNNKTKIYIFALASHGKGISGGDRIYIEFAKRWTKKVPLTIYQDTEGYDMFKRQGLVSTIDYKVFKPGGNQFGFFGNYIARIFLGIKLAFTLRLEYSSNTIIYSASEFWMDSLPGCILKFRYPKITWVATWFQTAPNPLKGFAEGERSGERYRLRALFYWLSQVPIKPLIAKFASYILVNNELEKKQFPRLLKKRKVIVVIGAVDIDGINVWRRTKQLSKTYDAVFQGRFHPQKGVIELIDIWRKVVDKKEDALLVMIGDGPLMDKVKEKITSLGLNKNILLKGYLFDGDKKYTIFSRSKLVVHPALFDSGGMAAAEAMAFGLACIGFDLPSYTSYYPYGMKKVQIGDLQAFSNEVLHLLDNQKMRDEISKQGLEMIQTNWSWNKRASDILIELTKAT